jgi:hypothetical protein
MKKIILVNPWFYLVIIYIAVIGEALALKPAISVTPANACLHKKVGTASTAATIEPVAFLADAGKKNPAIADADSIDFSVEVVQPRKFFLSFTKKREETIFIKIYDVIGNLIHHEVVSKKGIFHKQYDLSKYKTDLYVIEVGSGKKAKIKRLFLG